MLKSEKKSEKKKNFERRREAELLQKMKVERATEVERERAAEEEKKEEEKKKIGRGRGRNARKRKKEEERRRCKEQEERLKEDEFVDQQLNNSKLEKSELSTATKPVQGGREGKRDANGFINCTSCKTVHQTTQEFVVHCRSSKHIENSIWAEKLAAGGSADLKNTLGR